MVREVGYSGGDDGNCFRTRSALRGLAGRALRTFEYSGVGRPEKSTEGEIGLGRITRRTNQFAVGPGVNFDDAEGAVLESHDVTQARAQRPARFSACEGNPQNVSRLWLRPENLSVPVAERGVHDVPLQHVHAELHEVSAGVEAIGSRACTINPSGSTRSALTWLACVVHLSSSSHWSRSITERERCLFLSSPFTPSTALKSAR